MNIMNYTRSLLPDFSRSRVLEDIEVTRRELIETTLPVFRTAADLFGKKKLSSKYSEVFDSNFDRDTRINHKGNWITGTFETLENMVETLDMVESLVHKRFASDLLKETMTILKLNLLQFVELMFFVTRYSRRALIVCLTTEVNAANKDDEYLGILDAELKWLAANKDSFFRGIRCLSDKRKTVEERFEQIPEIRADEESIKMAMATAEPGQIDPMGFGLIPLTLNPIYHVRLAISEWQARRYRCAEEEAQMLNYRLIQLREMQNGNKDAALQQKIEYNQNRLNKIRYDLKQMEEDAGYGN